MSEKESIYVPEGEDKGRIEDPEVAKEIAELKGVARDREKERARQAEIGLTPEQERNLEIMDELRKRYPDSFEAVYYDGGKLALCTYSPEAWRKEGRGIGKGGNEALLIMEGQFIVSHEAKPSELDISALDKEKRLFREEKGKEDSGVRWASGKEGNEGATARRIVFTHDGEKKMVSAILRESARYKKTQAEKEKIPEIDELLKGV